MDDPNNQDELKITPEEQKFDEEATKEVQEEELRTKIAEDLGINADDEPELLDKLVEREKSAREKLSGAIKQKINWRTKAQETSKKTSEKKDEGNSPDGGGAGKPLTQEEVDKRFEEKMAERDLKDLHLPEEVEDEVRDLAKLKGVSVKEAAKFPYIVAKLDEIEKQKKIEEASPKRGGSGSTKISDIDYSKPLNPTDFDLTTEEGRKSWNEARTKRDDWKKNNSGK